MGVRQLGYRPYDGPRTPPSRNALTLARHFGKRSIKGALPKVLLFVGFLMSLGYAIYQLFSFFMTKSLWARLSETDKSKVKPLIDQLPEIHGTTIIGFESSSIVSWIMILLLLAAATSYPREKLDGALPLYFSKPLTRLQFLTGRIFGAAIPIAALLLVAHLLFLGIATLTATTMAEELQSNALSYALRLVVPCLLLPLLIALFVSTVVVCLSILAPGRAASIVMAVVFLLGTDIAFRTVSGGVDTESSFEVAHLFGYFSPAAIFRSIGSGLLKISSPAELPFVGALVALVMIPAGLLYTTISTIGKDTSFE